ncbi:MAG: transporter substrate-binding domain-containing protein [Clostridiaceae bacterium]|nr:transporter substrate-binding domain-containing protein [Clostridiaceae bacterium]
MKKLIALMMAALMLFAVAGCAQQTQKEAADNQTGQQTQKKEVLVMGTNAEFPPFEYKENNEIVGFDIEIAKIIAEELGMELKIEDMVFDGLLPALQSGKVDFVIAGMTVTEDRKKNVDFSESYFNASQVIIVKKEGSAVKSKDDLSGKKVGVQIGTTGDAYLTENHPDVEVVRFQKGADAIMELKNGKCDAVVIDANPAKVFVEKNSDLTLLEEQLTEEEYAIAVKKGSELKAQIDEILQKIKSDGRYDEIYAKYFPEETEETSNETEEGASQTE